MTFTYPAVLHQDENGIYHGYFPDLEGCTFSGKNIDEAIDDAISAEKTWIEVQMEEAEDSEDDLYSADLPFVSEYSDIPLKEGEFIRSIHVIMHFEVGYY